jgi:hypothetical protein
MPGSSPIPSPWPIAISSEFPRDEPPQKKPRGTEQIARRASDNEWISATQPRAIKRTLTSRIASVQTWEVFRVVPRQMTNNYGRVIDDLDSCA